MAKKKDLTLEEKIEQIKVLNAEIAKLSKEKEALEKQIKDAVKDVAQITIINNYPTTVYPVTKPFWYREPVWCGDLNKIDDLIDRTPKYMVGDNPSALPSFTVLCNSN